MDLTRSLHSDLTEQIATWTEVGPIHHSHWLPPPSGEWKINFDATLKNHLAFSAAVCRSSAGSIHFAWSAHVSTDNSLLAEACACLLACQATHDLCLERVTFKVDSPLTIRAINDISCPFQGPTAEAISKIPYLMAQHREWNFLWAPRRQNLMAHNLASWTGTSFCFGFLMSLPYRLLFLRRMYLNLLEAFTFE